MRITGIVYAHYGFTIGTDFKIFFSMAIKNDLNYSIKIRVKKEELDKCETGLDLIELACEKFFKGEYSYAKD